MREKPLRPRVFLRPIAFILYHLTTVLPLLFHRIEQALCPYHTHKMPTATVVSPSAGLPPMPNTNSFRSEIRMREAQFRELQKENFNLKLRVDHLTRRLAENSEKRRLSKTATPPPDAFYAFDDEEQRRLSGASANSVRYEEDSPAVDALKRELAKQHAENQKLIDRNYELSDALDDLQEKSAKDADKAEDQEKASMEQLQGFVNQVEDLESANLKKDLEVKQARESLENANRELQRLADEHKSEMEQKEKASSVRIEGLQMQYEAAVAAMEEQRTLASKATEKMASMSIEVRRVSQDLKQTAEELENVKELNLEEAGQIVSVRKELQAAQMERNALDAALKAEKERAGLWTEAGEFMESKDFLLSGESSALEQLVMLLQHHQKAYDNANEYQPRWREQVMGDMNECLRALYRSQRELEAQREEFMKSFCHSDSSFAGKPSLQPTRALPAT